MKRYLEKRVIEDELRKSNLDRYGKELRHRKEIYSVDKELGLFISDKEELNERDNLILLKNMSKKLDLH